MIKEALYTPPGAPRPEPVATLVYEGYEFEISYTLMHWITGWLAHGMFGAHSVPVAAKENTRVAFDRVRSAMMLDALAANGMIDLAMLPPFELPYPQPKKVVASVSKDDMHAQAIQRICEFMNTQFDALPDAEYENTVSRARGLADSLRMLHPTYEFEAHPVTDGKGDRSVRLCYWSNTNERRSPTTEEQGIVNG